jgi:hypothetical protein
VVGVVIGKPQIGFGVIEVRVLFYHIVWSLVNRRGLKRELHM